MLLIGYDLNLQPLIKELHKKTTSLTILMVESSQNKVDSNPRINP